METLKKQISLFTADELKSSQADFPVRTPQSQNKTAKVNRGYTVQEQDFFTKCAEPLKKSGHGTLSPKMSQTFLKLTGEKTLAEYSPNWPEWGTMQNGEFAVRQRSVRPITVRGCILLLTPTASDWKRDSLSFPMFTRRHHRSAGGLTEQLYRLFGAVHGQVNPRLYAWIMGYPEDWLEDSCTDTGTP